MTQMKIFVSHSSKDKAFCDQLVAALRRAGADVWYDEHNLGMGVLRREIMQQLAARPIFILALSAAALASDFVHDECEWAYNLFKREPNRMILPVVAAPYEPKDFNSLLFLESLKRVEAPGCKPHPPAEAIAQTLHLLKLVTPNNSPTLESSQPTESAADLTSKGTNLMALGRYGEAIPLLEWATEVDPDGFDAWLNLGRAYLETERWFQAVQATKRTTELNRTSAVAWSNRGKALSGWGMPEDALGAYDRALTLDPNFFIAWHNRGLTLSKIERYEEALASFDRALTINPRMVETWCYKGVVLAKLGYLEDALAALKTAVMLDPSYRQAWVLTAAALRRLGRHREAKAAERQAKALGG